MSTETNVVEETTTGEESQPTETGDASNQSPKLEIEHESELYKTEFFPQLYKDISISELPAEQIDEEEAFDEMLAELYEAALERVSWHIGLVVSIEGKD
jgi:hypothetical protein